MRCTEPELVSAVAHHEAGHAVAAVLAFRRAAWLPRPAPPQLVSYIKITEHAPGQWSGRCSALGVYSTGWSSKRIAEPYRPLMEAQIVIELAGGIAEAIHRGERRPDAILAHAASHCRIGTDLTRAVRVGGDLRRLTGIPFDPQPHAARALSLMLMHWPAVEALARALLQHRRIEGARVEAIIDHSMNRAEPG